MKHVVVLYEKPADTDKTLMPALDFIAPDHVVSIHGNHEACLEKATSMLAFVIVPEDKMSSGLYVNIDLTEHDGSKLFTFVAHMIMGVDSRHNEIVGDDAKDQDRAELTAVYLLPVSEEQAKHVNVLGNLEGANLTVIKSLFTSSAISVRELRDDENVDADHRSLKATLRKDYTTEISYNYTNSIVSVA